MNLQEWKESRRKKITLKSGLEVTVRQLSPVKLGEFGPIPYLEDISAEDQLKVAKSIITAGMYDPKIGEGENELSLYDLSIEDINELVEAVSKIGKRDESLPLAQGDTSTEIPPSS